MGVCQLVSVKRRCMPCDAQWAGAELFFPTGDVKDATVRYVS